MQLTATEGKSRGLKAVTSACFLLLVAALYLIDQNSPARGYELSIYDSLPSMAWIFLIASLAGATGIIVHQAFAGRKSRYWFLGFLILIAGVSIILLLPALRAYYMYGSSDTLAHTEWTRNVLDEGRIQKRNFYPVTHLLMTQLTQVSGAPPEAVAKYVPVLFTVLLMLLSYLLATVVVPKKGGALLAAATTALFFNYYHVCVYPQALSIMTLPLVFYLYFKGFGGASVPFRAAFVIVLLLFAFFHPATAAVLIACLLAAEAAKAMWRVRGNITSSAAATVPDRITLEPTFICSVAFLTWMSSFYILAITLRNLLRWLAGEMQSIPRVAEVQQMFETLGIGVQQEVVLALKMYGDNLIYLCLSAIALLIIGYRFARRQIEFTNLSILSMAFLVSGPAWVLVFAGSLLITFGRLLGANIMMWATPVLASLALYEMFGRWKRVGFVVVTSLLLCASVVGVFGVYQSPYILQPSWQVTRQDVRGSDWFLAHTESENRREFATLGIEPALASGRATLPEHFGYRQQQRLGQSWPMDVVVIMEKRSRLVAAHAVLSKTMISNWRVVRLGFEEGDFERLEADRSVGRLYSNGELDVMLATGEK